MCEHFIVDWQEDNGNDTAVSFVSLRMQGRKAGLYRVKQVRREGMLLSHGAISFPVGTRLGVEDVQGLVPGVPDTASVVANDQSGLCLAW